MDDIEACYGSAVNLPDILADCAEDWGQDGCDLQIADVSGETVGGWVQALTEEDATAECNARNECTWAQDEGSQALDALGYLMAEIEGSCVVGFLDAQEPWLEGCVVEGNVVQEVECANNQRLTAPPDAEYEMVIDSDLSWIYVDLPTESLYSALKGNAFAATNPAQFLLAFAWGEDFESQQDSFTRNHAILSAPIEVDPYSATYTVPVAQDFDLVFQGLRDGEEYVVTVDPLVASGGTFDPSGGTWSYHYNQAESGAAVTVHLEGSLMATSP